MGNFEMNAATTQRDLHNKNLLNYDTSSKWTFKSKESETTDKKDK